MATGCIRGVTAGAQREERHRVLLASFIRQPQMGCRLQQACQEIQGEVLPVEPDSAKADGAQEQAESPDDKWYKDPVVSRLHSDPTA